MVAHSHLTRLNHSMLPRSPSTEPEPEFLSSRDDILFVACGGCQRLIARTSHRSWSQCVGGNPTPHTRA
eukprot:388372-Amphidinium_carterae.2